MSIIAAIQGKRLLSFTYDGQPRIVEPHTLGIDTKGHLTLCAFQVGGGSRSGASTGWKNFRVEGMSDLAVLSARFIAPRPEYARFDKAFREIHAQL